MLALGIFAATIFLIIGDKMLIIKLAMASFLVPTLFALVYYIHNGRNPESSGKKRLRVLLFLCRLSVLSGACCLFMALFALSNQYHNYVPPETAGEASDCITTVETEDLYILSPGFDSVELRLEKRPSRRDKNVLLCAGAAFQLDYSFVFSYDKICGSYVSGGVRRQGYEDPGLGAFAYFDGTYHFANADGAEALIEEAAERGGCAFHQFLVIEEGEIVCEPIKKARCFRVLAELNGQLCIIDCKTPRYFHEFGEQLVSLGVRNAVYLDMGNGWNYSWYRDNSGHARTLIGLPWPFSKNWICFVKQ